MAYSLEADEQERKLFVGGLNKTLTDEDSLKSFFIKYGGIIDCTIMRDPDKQSRGFGFLLFEHSSSVDEIISHRKEGKSFTLDEHHIEVKRALPKVPGGKGGGGFSRGSSSGLFRKIFVGGLPSTITDDDLRKYFERFGHVTETELLRDRETNRLRGFAFVTFDDEDAADKTIQRRNHEICKKLCEVKRAQTRSTLNKFDDDDFHHGGNKGGQHGHRSRDRDDRHSGAWQSPSSLGINDVNQLIQQAFVMGQQSVMNHSAIQPPTAASLLNQLQPSPQYTPPAAANPLLQALMAQTAPGVSNNVGPIAPPSSAPTATQPPAGNNATLNQLAQLLQGRVDPNALSALLKQEDPSRTQGVKASGNGYSTSYPSTSTYDMYYNQSNTKDDQDTKRYRPY